MIRKQRATITIDYDPHSEEDAAEWVKNINTLRDLIAGNGYSNTGEVTGVTVAFSERRAARVAPPEQPYGLAKFRRNFAKAS